MEKQTALQYLIAEMKAKQQYQEHEATRILIDGFISILKETLPIEKQQIVEAYEKGKKNNPLQGFHTNTVFMNGNQYFESTYKTNL